MIKLKKIFALADIKYPWLLLLSIVAFTLALYFNRIYPDIYTKAELVIYGMSFIIALAWSIMNYVGHLRISALYKKHDNIEVFVSRLSMSKEEKADLTQYLNDFVLDLKKKGIAHDEAVSTAISHFQVQEFVESQGVKFETTVHFYLLGYVSIFIGIIIIIQCINLFATLPFVVLAACFVFILYSMAFVCLFFLYRLMDVWISRK